MAQESLNLIIAHPNLESISQIRTVVEKTHSVIAECPLASELRSAALGTWPDLLITAVDFPDGDGLDTVIELANQKPLPSVVVTTKRSIAMVEKAMLDHVMAYLIEPIKPEDLNAAILLARGRFEQLNELATEVEDLKLALEHRKIIERAKGVLMAMHGLDETEAFIKLRTSAQNDRLKLVDAAQSILDTQAETLG